MSPDDAKAAEQALNHAWESTRYHAEQRLTVVRFAITMIGGVAAGIGLLWKDGTYFLCALLSLFGILGAFAAWRIDKRTYDIIRAGESAVKAMEGVFATTLHKPSLNIVRKTNHIPKENSKIMEFFYKMGLSQKFRLPYRYTDNFALLYKSVMFIYLILLVYSLIKSFLPKSECFG